MQLESFGLTETQTMPAPLFPLSSKVTGEDVYTT